MTSLLQELKNPTWWVSVVVAGLIVNLAAAYLKGPLDRFWSRISTTHKVRSERKRLEYERFVSELRQDKDARFEVVLNELRLRITTVLFMVFVNAFLVLEVMQTAHSLLVPVLGVLVLFFGFSSMNAHTKAAYLGSALSASRTNNASSDEPQQSNDRNA